MFFLSLHNTSKYERVLIRKRNSVRNGDMYCLKCFVPIIMLVGNVGRENKEEY